MFWNFTNKSVSTIPELHFGINSTSYSILYQLMFQLPKT